MNKNSISTLELVNPEERQKKEVNCARGGVSSEQMRTAEELTPGNSNFRLQNQRT
jgi:hypothetical protein